MSAVVNRWAYTIQGLHKRWKPHAGQQPVIDSIFYDGITSAFIRCGRKWGKTEFALYLLWRIAQSFPGMPCYYFAAQQNQARGILWEDPRIKNFGPREWLLDGARGIAEGDMVLRFKNKSFIKIDGTDNYNKYRGVRYKVAVYDEYKDCDPRMRKAMRPNASVYGGIDVFMGSPPNTSGTDYSKLDKDHASGVNPKARSFHGPSWANPNISTQWLKDEKTGLYRKNEGDDWETEYAAKYVKSGTQTIFPMLDLSMRVKHDVLMKRLARDMKKLQWFWWADPAGSTCFAVLFCAINPYTKEVFWLDEIYEKRQTEMTVKKIGERIIKIRDELNPRAQWRGGYDEAASWFRNEWIDNFPEEDGIEPSQKAKKSKKDGLSLIKDIMLAGLWFMSDRCANFYTELDDMAKDKKGNIPKENDHLVDDARYILGAAYYELKAKKSEEEEDDEDFRGSSLESDLEKYRGSDDYEEY